jgi:hypothetical protein
VWEQGMAEGSEQINEFSRTDDEGREFMGWREFLAIVTPAMRAWGFRPEYKNPEIMYSRPGRSQDEFYVIILQPQNDMVQYSFMTVDHDQPDMHETNFVGMSRLGAQSLLDNIDDDYSLSDLKQDMAEAGNPARAGDLVGEADKKTLRNSNPCWKGYKPVGTKKKSGRTVPNCVPVSENVEKQMASYIKLLEGKK